MPKVRLEDVVDVTVFMDLEAENSPEKTAFFESGVVVRDPLADALADADGREGVLPFWLDLDPSTEPNYSSDQDTLASVDKTSQSEQRVRKAHLNKGWSVMDLTRELQTGVDAMRHIRNRFDKWWQRQWQRRIIATTLGLLNANVAGRVTASGAASDMIVDVSLETLVGQTAANRFNRSAFTRAIFTLGDNAPNLRAILVHSIIMKTMVDNDDIDYMLDSQGKPTIPSYMSHRVIVDDMCPVIAGTTSGFRYVSVLFGEAAFAYGEGTPLVPVEIDRIAASGHGGGEEIIWNRKTWLIHPAGHTNNGTTASGTGGSQTLANLQVAANWNRTHFRKNVPIAFLITNG